jgi:hypothetical protein
MIFTLVLNENTIIPDGWTLSDNQQTLSPKSSPLKLQNGQGYDIVTSRIARVLHYRVIVPYESVDPFGAPKLKKEHFTISQEEAESLFPGLCNSKTYRQFTTNHHVLHDLIRRQEERLDELQSKVEALVPKSVRVTYNVLAGRIDLFAIGHRAHFVITDYPREKDFYDAITKEVSTWSL